MTLIDGCVLVSTKDNRLKVKKTPVMPSMNGEEANILSAFSYPTLPLSDRVTDDGIESLAESNQKFNEPSTANESNDLKNTLKNKDCQSPLEEKSNIEGMVSSKLEEESADPKLNNKKIVSVCEYVNSVCTQAEQFQDNIRCETNLEEIHINSESDNLPNGITDKAECTDASCINTCKNSTIETSSVSVLKLNGVSVPLTSEVESSSSKCVKSLHDSSPSEEELVNNSHESVNNRLVKTPRDTMSATSDSIYTQIEVSNQKRVTKSSNCLLENDTIIACTNSSNPSNDEFSKNSAIAVIEPTSQADVVTPADLSFESASEEMILQVEEDELPETDFQSKITSSSKSETSEKIKIPEVENSADNAEEHLLCSDVSSQLETQPYVKLPKKSSETKQMEVCKLETFDPVKSKELSLCDKVSTQPEVELSNTLGKQCSKECLDLDSKQIENSISSSCTVDEPLKSDNVDKSHVLISCTNLSKTEEPAEDKKKSDLLGTEFLSTMPEPTVSSRTLYYDSIADSASSTSSEKANKDISRQESDVSVTNDKCNNISSTENLNGATENDNFSKSCSDEIISKSCEIEDCVKEECNVGLKVNLSFESSKKNSRNQSPRLDVDIDSKCICSSDESENSNDMKNMTSLKNDQLDKKLNIKPPIKSTLADYGEKIRSTSSEDSIEVESIAQEVLNKIETSQTGDDCVVSKENVDASESSFASKEESTITNEKNKDDDCTPVSELKPSTEPSDAALDVSSESVVLGQIFEQNLSTESIENASPHSARDESDDISNDSVESNKNKVFGMIKDKEKRKVSDTGSNKEEVTINLQDGLQNETKELQSGIDITRTSKDADAAKQSKDDGKIEIDSKEFAQSENEEMLHVNKDGKEVDSSQEKEESDQCHNQTSTDLTDTDHTDDVLFEEKNVDETSTKSLRQKELDTKEVPKTNDITSPKNLVPIDAVERSMEDEIEIEESSDNTCSVPIDAVERSTEDGIGIEERSEDTCSEEVTLDKTQQECKIVKNDCEEREDPLNTDMSSEPDTRDSSPSDDQKKIVVEAHQNYNNPNSEALILEKGTSMSDISESKKESLKQESNENSKESTSRSLSEEMDEQMVEISEANNYDEDNKIGDQVHKIKETSNKDEKNDVLKDDEKNEVLEGDEKKVEDQIRNTNETIGDSEKSEVLEGDVKKLEDQIEKTYETIDEVKKNEDLDNDGKKIEDQVEKIHEISDEDEKNNVLEELSSTDESDSQHADNSQTNKNRKFEDNSSKVMCMISNKEEVDNGHIITDTKEVVVEESFSIEDISRKVLAEMINSVSNELKNHLKSFLSDEVMDQDSMEKLHSVSNVDRELKELSESVSSITNDHLYSASPKSKSSEKVIDNFACLKRSASDSLEEKEEETWKKRARSDEDSLPLNKRRISNSSDNSSSAEYENKYKKLKIQDTDEDSVESSDEDYSMTVNSDSENESTTDAGKADNDIDDLRENSDSCSSLDQCTSTFKDNVVDVGRFNRFHKSLHSFKRKDLEEMVVLKMLEVLKYKGIAGDQQKQLINLQEQCAAQKKLLLSIKKQFSENTVIMKKFIEESECQLREGIVVPKKATRSVGLQVAMADPIHTSKLDTAPSENKKNTVVVPKPDTSSAPAPAPSTKPKAVVPPVVSTPSKQQDSVKTKLVNTVIPVASPKPSLPTVKVLTPVSRSSLISQTLAQSKAVSQTTTQIITTLAQKPLTLRTKASNLEVIDLVDDSQQHGRSPGIQNISNKGLTVSQSLSGQMQQQISYVVTSGTQVPIYLSPTLNQGTRMMTATNNRGVLGTSLKNGQIIQLQNKTGVLAGNQFHLLTTNAAQFKQVIRPVNAVNLNPGSKTTQIKHVPRILRPVHPAPLPVIQCQSSDKSWKLRPPKPTLRIGKNGSGITLSWTLNGYDKEKYAEIVSYQLFAYQEGTEPPSTDLWKKVGDVTALALPMACTLTKLVSGHRYHFAVQAVDIHSRFGEYSVPENIMLN